jgi:hypothetical protein
MEKIPKTLPQGKKGPPLLKLLPLINIILIQILSGTKNHINQKLDQIILLTRPKKNLILTKYTKGVKQNQNPKKKKME